VHSTISYTTLRNLIAVVDERDYVRASQALHISVNELRREVALLEQQLSLKIFQEDDAKVLKLTIAGTAFISVSREALARFR
jgi:DNA-binding transcriptional LysR family regulator